MHRRNFIIAAPLAVAGCATFTDADVVAAAQKASILASGARDLLSALGGLGIPQLTPKILADCGVAISGLQAAADGLAAAIREDAGSIHAVYFTRQIYSAIAEMYFIQQQAVSGGAKSCQRNGTPAGLSRMSVDLARAEIQDLILAGEITQDLGQKALNQIG